jgi:hypothetical protein
MMMMIVVAPPICCGFYFMSFDWMVGCGLAVPYHIHPTAESYYLLSCFRCSFMFFSGNSKKFGSRPAADLNLLINSVTL